MVSYYTFPAIIEKAGETYGVYFPDLPGCVATGSTVEEVLALAKEGLAFHLNAMERDGDDIPKPTPYSSVKLEAGEVLCILDANMELARKIA